MEGWFGLRYELLSRGLVGGFDLSAMCIIYLLWGWIINKFLYFGFIRGDNIKTFICTH